MAEYIIESLSTSKYFKFDDDRESAGQCSMEEATGFGSEELALTALKGAAERLAAKAKSGVPTAKWAQMALTLPLEEMKKKFTVSARPTLSDLVGIFDAFYVRSPNGWLSRPHLRAHDGRLWWSKSFAFAAQFPDAESAARAMRDNSHWSGSDGGSVVKASCVFTDVIVSDTQAKIADPVRGAIQSACEARDISAELEASVKERADAMAPAAAASPKRARL